MDPDDDGSREDRAPCYLKAVELIRREGWDDDVYPFNLPVVRGLELLNLHPRCTFFVGENGSGKSTMIEAIAVVMGFNAEGGSRDHGFRTRMTHSPLHEYVRPHRGHARQKDGWFLRSESLYSTLSYLDDVANPDRHGGSPLHERSHGESVFALLEHRFQGDGLYILDEPEAGLSPARQLSFLTRMDDLVRARSQFIVASHSPIILAYPDAWIYQAGPNGLERIEYEATDHYEVTRSFLNRRETFLKVLLADD